MTDENTLSVALIENLQREDLNALEEAAGIQRLLAEASFCSRPLLLRSGWIFIESELIEIGGIGFQRFKMKKELL